FSSRLGHRERSAVDLLISIRLVAISGFLVSVWRHYLELLGLPLELHSCQRLLRPGPHHFPTFFLSDNRSLPGSRARHLRHLVWTCRGGRISHNPIRHRGAIYFFLSVRQP